MLNELLKVYLEIAVEGDTEGGTPTDTNGNNVDPNPEGGQTGNPDDSPEPEETFFEIDGEKLTPQQIKEFKQGYLRQADYTKKTQEIANQRNQYKEAVELYEYFKANPHLAKKLSEMEDEGASDIKNVYNPQNDKLIEIDTKIKAMEINHELEMLKLQDPDLNEIELLNLANQKVMPIQDAYHLWKGMNFDKILKDKLSKQSADLTEQIKKGNSKVTTLMNPNDKVNNNNHGLTAAEMVMADKLFDGNYEEYAKWKS